MTSVVTRAVAPTNRRPNVVIFHAFQIVSDTARSSDVPYWPRTAESCWLLEQARCHTRFHYDLNKMGLNDQSNRGGEGANCMTLHSVVEWDPCDFFYFLMV